MAGANIVKERQFHDAWAFYLFIIFLVGMNTFFLFNSKDVVASVIEFQTEFKILSCFLLNLGFTVAFLLLSLIFCSLIPKFLIVTSVLAIPILSAVSFFSFGLNSIKQSSVIAIVLFVFNFIFLIIAGITILSNLEYLSLALKSASKIFFENFFGIFFLQIFTFLLYFLSLVPVAFVDAKDNQIIGSMRYSAVLLFAWISCILKYFMEVFVSSVVFFHIQKKDQNVFLNSISNSLYALGSIAFGALIAALITVLKAMANDASSPTDANGNPRSRNAVNQILLGISRFLLNALESFVKFANNLAYSYLSINGTDYKESVTQSFQSVMSSGYEKIASYWGLDFIIATLSFFFSTVLYLFNTKFLFPALGLSATDKNGIIYAFVIVILFALLFYLNFSLLKSSVMALIFATITCHEELREYDPKFIETIENEKKKLVPAAQQ
jgi:hypothetical protein